MNKYVIKYFIKLTVLIFVVFMFISTSFSLFIDEADADKEKIKNITFKKVTTDANLGNIGVAIAINIGTRHKQRTETPVSLYKDVLNISYILANKETARDHIVTNNMILLHEYLNVLKTDLKSLLGQSNDRLTSLEAFIDQLEFRYENSLSNIKMIKKQMTVLSSAMERSSATINSLKTKIGVNFNKFETDSTIENINSYLKAKEEYTYSRTYAVLLSKIIKYYSYLSSYNKKLLDTLINNKEAIVKNSHIVIPDTGSGFLKKLELLYEEKDFKSKK